MLAIELIRQKINREVFDYTQLMEVLKEYKKPRDVVTSLIKNEQIIRIRKGIYIFGKIWQKQIITREMLANLIYGPSVISLDYALAFYGLIPERIEVVTSITNGRSREFQTPIGDFSYTQMKGDRITFGNSYQKSTEGNWLITLPLKALFDKIWCDKRFKPTSPASYSDFLRDDLRIDMNLLMSFFDREQIVEFQRKFDSRKIDWLVIYLINEFGE